MNKISITKTIILCTIILSTTFLTVKSILTVESFLIIVLPIISFLIGNKIGYSTSNSNKKRIE